MTCSASTLEEVVDMVKIVASNQQQNAQEIKEEIEDEIKDVKTLLVSGSVETNDARLEDALKQIKEEIRDVKTLLTSESGATNETCRLEDDVKEIKDEIRLLAANQIKIELDAGEPSKQAIISALVCEYLVCFFCLNKAHKEAINIDKTVLMLINCKITGFNDMFCSQLRPFAGPAEHQRVQLLQSFVGGV